ncbi:MAG: DUF4252 domain-containing protein [Bacteroidota bacterium]
MKNILLALFLISVPVIAFGQNKALNKFYRKHKRGKEVQNAKLPGWLIRFGGKIAIKNADMDQSDQELARKLLKKAGGVKFMYSEDGTKIPKSDIQELKNSLHRDHQFDDLIMIKSGEMDFQLMINESGGVVKSVFMLFNDLEAGEMAFVTMKMNISLDEITKLAEQGVEEHYHEIMDIEEEPVEEPIM